MKPAISIIGPPASGKSTLLRPYWDRVLAIGNYAKSLCDGHPLKPRCCEYWKKNKVFSSDLLRDLLESYPVMNSELVLLDGTPRNQAQEPLAQSIFDIVARVIITIDDDVWGARAWKAVLERSDRPDSTLEKLKARKAVYERKTGYVHQMPNKFYLDNSGSLEQAQRSLESILIRIDTGSGGKNDRIYGRCG